MNMRNWRLMTCVTRATFFLVPVACILAQETPAKVDGVTSEWDVKAKMEAMATDVARLEDLLRRARPHEWIANGAPSVYTQQLESAKANMALLIEGTEKLAKQPERLSTALDVLFRMDNMDILLNSLQGGIRKYQGPAVANDIQRFVAEHSRHREMLRQHSIDLAAVREQEFRIISDEAQRCRTELSRKDAPETQPVTAKPRQVRRRQK
jgi:hypothetical protein